MKKIIMFWILGSIFFFFIIGCGQSEKDWEKARKMNTIANYE